MPPGAKKRKVKAAKKKQQQQTKSNSASHSHGNDDLQVHYEKESDGGDTGSPTSQDHHNHQHEGEEEEEEMEKREDTSSVRSIVAENEPLVGINSNGENTQKVEMEGNSVINIDWELEQEDDYDRKKGGAEFVESMKESNGGRKSKDGGSSSSSSSSGSDDESHVVEKNIVVIDSRESKEELVEEITTFADSVKTTDLPQVAEVTDDVLIGGGYNLAVDEAYDPISSKADASDLVVETATSADPVKTTDLPEVTQVTDGVPVTDAYSLAVEEPREEAYDPVAENAFPVNLVDTADLPEVIQVADSLPDIEAYSLVVEEPSNLVVETIPPVDSETVTKDVVHVNDSTPVENPKCSGDFESGLKENGENGGSGVSALVMDTRSQLVNDSTQMENPTCSSDFEFGLMENGKIATSGVLPAVIDTESQPKEDKVSPSTVEYIVASSVAMGSAPKEYKEKLMLSSNVPPPGNDNDAKTDKDYVATGSDGQPLVASVPQPVHKASWNSCCGVFELFKGSDA